MFSKAPLVKNSPRRWVGKAVLGYAKDTAHEHRTPLGEREATSVPTSSSAHLRHIPHRPPHSNLNPNQYLAQNRIPRSNSSPHHGSTKHKANVMARSQHLPTSPRSSTQHPATAGISCASYVPHHKQSGEPHTWPCKHNDESMGQPIALSLPGCRPLCMHAPRHF
jgi:hypothetical protein